MPGRLRLRPGEILQIRSERNAGLMYALECFTLQADEFVFHLEFLAFEIGKNKIVSGRMLERFFDLVLENRMPLFKFGNMRLDGHR